MNEKKNILSLQEQEQRRIANDLHDTTVQELVHLSQQLELINAYIDRDVNQAKLEIATTRKNIKNIIQNMRDTIYELRPMSFDDLGWKLAIERLESEIINKNDISVIFEVDELEGVDPLILISIYRIIREACINVCKHASANTLSVKVKKQKDNIFICIKDDGKGFNISKKKPNHFGLLMIKEKVDLLSGKFEISSTDKGTLIEVFIPQVDER